MVTQKPQPQTADPLLAELARLHGVQTAYRDYEGRWRASPVESIVLVLRALGAELGDTGAEPLRDVTRARLTVAIRERRRKLWSRVLEPVIVAWEGRLSPVTVRLPAGISGPGSASRRSGGPGGSGSSKARSTDGRLALVLEDGTILERRFEVDHLSVDDAAEIGRQRFEARRLSVPRALRIGSATNPLPLGYHRLRLEMGHATAEATVISAPRRCWSPRATPGAGSDAAGAGLLGHARARGEGGVGRRSALGELAELMEGRAGRPWGLFAPLYALRSERDWGAGDLAELENLGDRIAEAGGTFMATLPLLASYLDKPFEPSPYRPVSRLFWNEFYLAVDQLPEWARCEAAGDLWNLEETQALVHRLRAEPLVHYREVTALKRASLERLARCFFESGDAARAEAFAAYKRDHSHAEEYAAFRARSEAAGSDWRKWSGPAGSTQTRSLFEDDSARNYHLYCQWQMEEQLTRASGCRDPRLPNALLQGQNNGGALLSEVHTHEPCGRLFLDLPLGVHPGGFDTWRWPGLFVMSMSTGAPPDDFFAGGQNWSVPPFHPAQIREDGYEYFAECLRNHMRHACCLRVDHVMAFHRLYWVPNAITPDGGVYVEYPSSELYSVLCLESQRHQVIVAGEDLGTVPAGVRSAMSRHGLLRTWVLQTSLRPRAASPIGPVPRKALGLTSTHDMFPLAGFLRGGDIASRLETGQMDPGCVPGDQAARKKAVRRLRTFLGLGDSADEDDPDVLRAVLAWLASSSSEMVVVNLEDLLSEVKPQNEPGTGRERGNWRRKLQVNLENLFTRGETTYRRSATQEGSTNRRIELSSGQQPSGTQKAR